MGPRTDIALSLGKTVAQITADFAPIPGLCVGVECLCTIIALCENVAQNRNAARHLRDRCHLLLLALRDSEKVTNSQDKVNTARNAVNDCLLDVQTRMDGWAHIGKFQGFTKQREIAADIEHCHASITDCLTNFQLVSHMEIHDWKDAFTLNAKHDHAELVEYLAEIQNQQTLTTAAVNSNTELLQQMMGMMQAMMGDTIQNADRVHLGISKNLYQLQMQSGLLLPNFHLKSGEVKRIGEYPVSGTAGMDIYEGLYLGREKVAIKVIRAVNANENSLRRFHREVKIWSEIWKVDGGRHILPFYGFCQNEGPFPFMVSPWQKNGNALSYVKNHDTSVNYKHLIRNIAIGLDVLHSMSPPVIHGDIKAANIFINDIGNPLLADFRLSQIIQDITGIPFTQSRGVSESYRWFAPEVCIGFGILSVSSDIYGFAMTVLELLTHAQPYANIKHTTEVVIQSSRGYQPMRPIDARVIARGLDDRMWSLLTRCWSLEPSARPASMKDILAALPE